MTMQSKLAALVVAVAAAISLFGTSAAHAAIHRGGTPIKHHRLHGPCSSHNPIVRHPLHGSGSSHNPIVATGSCKPYRYCWRG